jgi:hypothetical protein
MKLLKEEIKLANGFNQFNLVDENNLIVGVVAGFTNEQNLQTATLFENAPEMYNMLKGIINNQFAMEHVSDKWKDEIERILSSIT